MIKFWAICRNTFVQTVRQPLYGIIIWLVLAVLVLQQPLTMWTMGNLGGDFQKTDQQMLIQNGLCTLLVGAMFLAAFSASSALRRELEDRTALTVISKPVSRATFIAGKFAGVAGAMTAAFYLTSLVFLMIVRHQVRSAVYEPYDMPVIVLGLGALVIAIFIAFGGNIFFGWNFISSAVYSMLITVTLAMAVLMFVGKDWQTVPPGYDAPPKKDNTMLSVKLRDSTDAEAFKTFLKSKSFRIAGQDARNRVLTVGVPSDSTADRTIEVVKDFADQVQSVDFVYDKPVISKQIVISLILMLVPVLILTAVGVSASVRWGQVLTLMACGTVLYLGLMHAWMFGDRAEHQAPTTVGQTSTEEIATPDVQTWADKVVLVRLVSPLVPKLNYFYLPTALSADKDISWGYVGTVVAYGLLYMAGILALGIALFQRQSIEAEGGAATMPGLVGMLAWGGRFLAVLLGLLGIEGVLSFIVSRYDPLFEPATFDMLGSIVQGGRPIVSLGLLMCLALLAMSVIGWVVWTFFGRGVRWAYWLAFAGGVLLLGQGLTFLLVPAVRQLTIAQNTVLLATEAILAGLVLLMLVLPSTRRHFHKTNR